MAPRRPYNRTERLNRQLREILAIAVQRETREEVLHEVVVTGVEVTNDLSLARVYYYLMGGDPEEVREAFGRAAGFLRSRIGQQARIRHVPELRFLHDDAIDRGRRVEAILEELHDGDPGPDESGPADDEAETSGDER